MSHHQNPHRKPDKFYLATSIPYANAKPHLGHALEFVQGDVLARHYRAQDVPTEFHIGTDEHGQKLFEAATEAGRDPREFVNEMSQTFIELAGRLNISYDQFVRTTTDEHKAAAQAFWRACSKHIYKGTYSGLYCTACEQYYTAKEAVDDHCPVHPNRLLEELAIDSYFLPLAPHQERLIHAIETGELCVFPELRRNETLSFLKNNRLEDLSISRPKSQLEWGVEVPDDPEHVMYVWFDALFFYASSVGYASDEARFKQWWPIDLHVIGKDINRFHSVYWPCMLYSGGLALPKAIYVHGFINAVGGVKMSKSLGNSVSPDEILERYGTDALRYYLLRYIPHDGDGEIGLERFHAVYTADLVNDLGNAVQRVAVMLGRNNGGRYDAVAAKPVDLAWAEDANFDGFLNAVFARVTGVNKLLEDKQPWQLVKSDQAAAVAVLSEAANELAAVAQALTAFLPETADKILATFKDGVVDGAVGILFPRVEPKEVA